MTQPDREKKEATRVDGADAVEAPAKSTAKLSGPPSTARRSAKGPQPSPPWWAPTMVILMVIGLAWIVTMYLTQGKYPIDLGNANLLIGFGIILVGFGMTTRWR